MQSFNYLERSDAKTLQQTQITSLSSLCARFRPISRRAIKETILLNNDHDHAENNV